ncbi:hypothetical protein FUT69_06545 [Xylella taiwanensis]|uniref:Uncharacterized protein n=1 Tax=Xylella taiwanensis TaxID=1444770 RepID=Z9JG05_9GAMM|nr:hypothetical protein [Xylella taiwanensis]AXI83382.1 hypothetical protein AB672_05225 [Xylella taiwanensis]EWS77099.1 hypothetical protein AF72_12535 [Xylella taiwanensis]MCD8456449.1 hypothetical protein [Xylella taiwanensis]MCD8458856.1 hypothetical protein [Xylella taiwanensis]MCD8460993.1 hypothetical protein [Xylella taiwanensis]
MIAGLPIDWAILVATHNRNFKNSQAQALRRPRNSWSARLPVAMHTSDQAGALILTAGHAQQHVAHPSSKCVIVDNAQDADACVRGVQARTKEALNRSKRRLERHDSRRCTAQQ